MAQATETFALGGTQVTTVVEIDLNTVWLISGDFAGTIPAGQVGFINGNVNLTGDLIVEGLLTGVDTFTLTGNSHQILVQHGGQLNLQGVEKSGWKHWGDTPVGWQTGDRLRVAPTAVNVFLPQSSTWGGTWGTTTRPPNSPDVTLPSNPYHTVAKPEVANLTRSIVLKNLSRIHFHDGAGVQNLKWLAVVNSGVTAVLAQYPIHFHLCGETVRNSLVEGVVVEAGKNHAFVPHASHGITFRDCVAYDITDDAYWWDSPSPAGDTTNDTNDLLYDHCLAMWVKGPGGGGEFRAAAFFLITGHNLSIIDSSATCMQGGQNASGFHWPEIANEHPGGNVWRFERNISHNNLNDGIQVWQNDFNPHIIQNYIGYRNGLTQIDHGAYSNSYDYFDAVLMGGSQGTFLLHAVNAVGLRNIYSDGTLRQMKHNVPSTTFISVTNCSFPTIYYSETGDGGVHGSKTRYIDCGLTPADFDMSGAVQSTVAEIIEDGVILHRWNFGQWAVPQAGDVVHQSLSALQQFTTTNPHIFNFTPAGVAQGIILTISHGFTGDLITGAKYGGVPMTRIVRAVDSGGAPGQNGASYIYFLGSGIPEGTQMVRISTTGTGTPKAAVLWSVSAEADTEIGASGTVNNNTANPQIPLDTGERSSLRYLAVYSGRDSVSLLQNIAGMTTGLAVDYGSYHLRFDRQTDAATGLVNIGYIGATDDVALAAVAVQKVPR